MLDRMGKVAKTIIIDILNAFCPERKHEFHKWISHLTCVVK